MPDKRLVGSVVNQSKLGFFVMDCVEENKSRVSQEWTQFVEAFDPNLLTPQILLGELESAMEYIENLKDAIDEAYDGSEHSHEHEHVQDY